jgi:iron complex transport system substrate-binding protein
MCGGENAAKDAQPLRQDSPLAPWGVERVVSLSGEIDIYLVQQGAMNTSTRDDVLARPWFRAFDEAQLKFIQERYLSRPSLIGLERGIHILSSIFYPNSDGIPE